MTYTAAQLTAAYTAANDGVAPDAATIAVINSDAAASLAGTLSDAAALAKIINSADRTTAVAVQAYQFFTGKTPSKAGLDFLVNSAGNPSDLNDPYYQQFNIENRYINFAANLGLIGEGAANFAATYGALSFTAFINSTYETIIGSSYVTAAGFNPQAAIADIISRQAAFTQTARDRGLITTNSTAAQIDLATKAAAVGYLLVEGIKADLGVYAAGSNNFVAALVAGTAQYNINLLTTYSVLGGGTGSPLPPQAVTTNLTAAADNFTGTANADTVNGLIYSNSGTAPFITTFSGIDTLNGAGGTDVLNLQVSQSAGGATGALTVPVVPVTSFEIVNVRSLSSTASDVTTVAANNFTGATNVNSDRSINAVAVTGLATGAAAGVIGATGVANGNLTFGYATTGDAATLNLTAGANPALATISSTPAAVTVNTSGTAPISIGAGLALGGAATSLTLSAQVLTTIGTISGFAPGATVTVNGAATNPSTGNLASVILNVLHANVATVNAAGLTAGGVGAFIGNNLGLNFTGGAGSDQIVALAGLGVLTGTINAGGGFDTLTLQAATDLGGGNGAKFTNFEQLNLGNAGAAATLQAYDASLISGITSYLVRAATGSVQINNLGAAPSVTAFGSLVGTNAAGALSLRLANAGGATDAVTLTLDNFNFTAAPNTAGVGIVGLSLGGSATAGQIETLNVVSQGVVTSTAGLNAFNTLILAASGAGPNFADPNTIRVTGAGLLNLATGVLGHAVTVDASAATGGLNFTSAAGGAFAVNVNGSTVNDTIVIGAGQTGVILGGVGADLINIAAGGGGVLAYRAGDSQLDLDPTHFPGVGQTGAMDFVLGWASGVDKVRVSDLGAGFAAGLVIADKGSTASSAAVLPLLQTATFFQDTTNTLRKVAQFDAPWANGGAGGTFLVADVNGNGTYDAGDLVVFLAGVGNVASGDLV
jgi:hypothetical protein